MIRLEIPRKLRVSSLVHNYRRRLSDGLEAECNVYKKCVPVKPSNTSNIISYIRNQHKGPFKELSLELYKQKEARKVKNQKRNENIQI